QEQRILRDASGIGDAAVLCSGWKTQRRTHKDKRAAHWPLCGGVGCSISRRSVRRVRDVGGECANCQSDTRQWRRHLVPLSEFVLVRNCGHRKSIVRFVSGFMNMRAQVGGAVTAQLTPWIAKHFGWTTSFLVA